MKKVLIAMILTMNAALAAPPLYVPHAQPFGMPKDRYAEQLQQQRNQQLQEQYYQDQLRQNRLQRQRWQQEQFNELNNSRNFHNQWRNYTW